MLSAQASLESVALLGIALLVILFFAVLASDIASGLGSQRDYEAGRAAVAALAEAAGRVHSQGEGASMLIDIEIPHSASLLPNESYIGRHSSSPTSASPNIINLRVAGTDIFALTAAPLAGAFPGSPGKHRMNVTSRGSFVSIGAGIISLFPGSVYLSMQRSSNSGAQVNFTTLQSGGTTVLIGSQWPFASPALSAAPSSFSTASPSTTPVSVNFTTNSTNGGIYTGYLNVTAYLNSSPQATSTFYIPVVLEVQVG